MTHERIRKEQALPETARHVLYVIKKFSAKDHASGPPWSSMALFPKICPKFLMPDLIKFCDTDGLELVAGARESLRDTKDLEMVEVFKQLVEIGSIVKDDGYYRYVPGPSFQIV